MVTIREQHTYDSYAQRAREGHIDDTEAWIDDFTSWIFRQMKGDRRIVDVGCGCGRFVPLLKDLAIPHEKYFGIDPVLEQVQLAQSRFPTCTFEVGSIYDIGTSYPGAFDGFWCSCVLMHLPRKRLHEALVSLRNSVKTEAVGFISTPGGSGCVRSTYDRRIILTLYDINELTMAFAATGFEARFYSPDNRMLLGAIRAI